MEVNIPTNYNEITIEQLIRWSKAVEENQLEILEHQLVSIFCNVPFKDTVLIPIKDFNEIVSTLQKLFESEPVFIDRFELNGTKYGFIPNLDNLTTAEYIDMDTYFNTDPLRFMAVMYRPIKSKFKNLYEIEEYDGTEKRYLEMAHATASTFLGAKVFFYNLSIELLKHIPTFLQQEMTAEQLITLEKNGGGISVLTQSLEEITSSTRQYMPYQFFSF